MMVVVMVNDTDHGTDHGGHDMILIMVVMP